MLQREPTTLKDHLVELSAWAKTVARLAESAIDEVARSGQIAQPALMVGEWNRAIELCDEELAVVEELLGVES